MTAAFSNCWLQGGWIGVDLFFVLSGFLVSGLLFHEFKKYESIDTTRFLIRRGFKIYPAFWALIATTLAFGWLKGSQPDVGGLLSEVLFFQSYFPGMWNHTWSLAVEEHFYLLLAGTFAFLVCRRESGQDPLAIVPKLFCVVAIVCLTLRVTTALSLPYGHMTHVFPTHLRIDSLMFGVFLAHSWHRNGFVHSNLIQENASPLIGLGILMLLPAFLFPLEATWWISVFGVSLFYVGGGAILIGLLHRGVSDTPAIRWIAMLGTYSYSIYLWHMPVHNWFVPAITSLLPEPLSENWFIYSALFLSGSFIVGVQMAKLIESPVLVLRNKWFPSRSRAMALQEQRRRENAGRSGNSSYPTVGQPTGNK